MNTKTKMTPLTGSMICELMLIVDAKADGVWPDVCYMPSTRALRRRGLVKFDTGPQGLRPLKIRATAAGRKAVK